MLFALCKDEDAPTANMRTFLEVCVILKILNVISLLTQVYPKRK